jgi:hypothetical protein
MGLQKNGNIGEPLGVVKILAIVFFVLLTIALMVYSIKNEDKFAREQALKEAAFIHPDTLYISRDLHNEDNLVRFVNDEYPLYKILEYKHIDSEYSAWNGAHNFYEFILIKK